VSLITLADMEARWVEIRSKTADGRAGIFGPDSVSWKVNRESALFLGAGRAALLQLAHPWVATALDQHSNLRNDPLARFHNTFRVVFTMIFGSLEQALKASRNLYQMHTQIQGEMPGRVARYEHGSHYRANEMHALIWVYATLIDSAVLAYECVLPPLTDYEREVYYAESKTMAALFGIPADTLPAGWADFQVYMQGMFESDALGVNDLSRELADRVMHGQGSWVPVPRWYRTLTAGWISPRFRDEFKLDYRQDSARTEQNAPRWLPWTYHSLPNVIRYVGPYREARARLAGRAADLTIRASNRFWMGAPRMMFPELKG
jgi:uncharacterized protein (DUF2236 family)